MILEKMVLDNFRQFKGRQEIVFATGGPSRKSPCITVLYGENGRGKTGIYRALMFGLYGESKLSQDEQVKAGELNLVNRHLLELHPETPLKAVVEIEFSHHDCQYHLYRELTGVRKKNGEILEQAGEALLRVQDSDGNTSVYDEPQDIRQQINGVLDFRVREYFLFDGEKIERLTRSNQEQRKEVSDGIRNLLNIDDLDKSIRAADKLCRDLDQDVKKKSSGELQQVIQEINTREDARQELEEKIGDIGQQLKLLQRQKRALDDKLGQYQDIQGLVADRKQLENDKAALSNHLISLGDDCRKQSPQVAFGLIQQTLRAVFASIDAKREKGDIPPLLRSDLIEQLLKTHRCICGRELVEDTDPFDRILKWMSKTPKSEETDAALHVWKQLDAIVQQIPARHTDATNHLMQYSNAKDKLQRIDTRLEAIAEQIGANERTDAVEWEKMREKLEQNQIALSADETRYQDDLSTNQSTLEELAKKREGLENDESIRNSLIRRSQMARSVRDALKGVFESFKIEAAQMIGRYATQTVKLLLDEESRRNLQEIIVQDDYSLQVVDQWGGRQFLANISAGQRQIMSIAFITALARAASGNSVLEMPLFMDTPFGRLSQEHRNNLIREIPGLSSQWVLLATDTELRREEGQALLNEKRLGRFYRLAPQPDGTTSIREQTLEEVPVLLKATMEKIQ